MNQRSELYSDDARYIHDAENDARKQAAHGVVEIKTDAAHVLSNWGVGDKFRLSKSLGILIL